MKELLVRLKSFILPHMAAQVLDGLLAQSDSLLPCLPVQHMIPSSQSSLYANAL